MNKLINITTFLFMLFVSSCFAQPEAGASIGGRMAPDGKTEINIDLPESQHLRNTGGIDGAGLCVFTSISHSARWQNEELLENLRDYMKQFRGGGWPARVDTIIKQIAKEKNMPIPDYIQVEGRREVLPILRKAIDNGLCPAITYGRSPTGRYNGRHIDHMVTLVHMDDKYVAILDNNYPGWNNYEWMTIEQFYSAFTDGSGSGWAVILLHPGPPMFPYNR